MSLDFYLKNGEEVLFDRNITHNLNKKMTTHDKNKIFTAAKEAGLTTRGNDYWAVCATSELERLYAIAFEDGRQAEREDCAKVCMQQCSVIEEPHEFERCAEAIRARGDSK